MEETVQQTVQRYEVLVQERLDNGLTIKDFCEMKGFSKYHYCRLVSYIHTFDPDFNTGGNQLMKGSASEGTFVELLPQGHATTRSMSTATDHKKMSQSREPVAEIQSGVVTVTLFRNADAQFMGQLLEAIQHA